MLKTAFSAIAAGSLCTLVSTAGQDSSYTGQSGMTSETDPSLMSMFDVARAAYSYAGGMDLDGASGELNISRFELSTLLSKPFSPVEGLSIIPKFEYEFTRLNFNDTSRYYPVGDEDLHALAVSAFAISSHQGSPWIYGAWARAQMATDFQDVDSDDFTFDLAGGVGYRFSPAFLFGVGAAVTNLNGDTEFYPGIGFDWAVNEQVRIGLYGPTFEASYTPSNDWQFTLRGETAGGIWNIRDDRSKSRSIDLTSYRAGLYANRRLTGNLWFNVGAGITFGNEIKFTYPNGDSIDQQDLESGYYGEIGLRLRTW